MSKYYGSIDLTALGEIVRKQPGLVREVNMRDGSTHKFLNIDIYENDAADQYGNIASIKVSCKQAERIDGLKYYVANLKPSQQQQQQAPSAPAAVSTIQPAAPAGQDDLPF